MQLVPLLSIIHFISFLSYLISFHSISLQFIPIGISPFSLSKGWGRSVGSIVGGSGGPALVLFLFYVNVSGMRPRSCLSFQLLPILAPWVLLRVRWSIPLASPCVTASRSLLWNREAELKPTNFSSLLHLRVLSFLFS